MPISIHNEIEIRVAAKDLFNYVTQPWLWHQWHPSSISASAAHSFTACGDEFTEQAEARLLPHLPITRRIEYTVTEAVPFHTWEARGKMKDGWIRIRYDFEEKGGVTFFARSMDMDVTGLTRILLPLLKPKMEKLSMVALNNLKSRMQETSGES
jgi:hypothetical protein